jgi:hypothetical protein
MSSLSLSLNISIALCSRLSSSLTRSFRYYRLATCSENEAEITGVEEKKKEKKIVAEEAALATHTHTVVLIILAV